MLGWTGGGVKSVPDCGSELEIPTRPNFYDSSADFFLFLQQQIIITAPSASATKNVKKKVPSVHDLIA